MIRHKTGIERLRVALTGLRQYRCCDCDQKFRAPDRRKRPRPDHAGARIGVPTPGLADELR